MTNTLTPGSPSTGDPGEDCGVRGGCHACPLFQANVCGDPAPALSVAIDGYDAVNDAELPGMWEVADFTGGLDEVRPPKDALTPVCVQTRTGVVPCGTSVHCTSREEAAEVYELTPRTIFGLDFGAYMQDVFAANAAYWEWRRRHDAADLPDVDPAEPKPEGAGCCGGACGA